MIKRLALAGAMLAGLSTSAFAAYGGPGVVAGGTSLNFGDLMFCAVVTTAPGYTAGQTQPCTETVTGAIRVGIDPANNAVAITFPDSTGTYGPGFTTGNPGNIQGTVSVGNASPSYANAATYDWTIPGINSAYQSYPGGIASETTLKTVAGGVIAAQPATPEGAALQQQIQSANPVFAPLPFQASASAGLVPKATPGVVIEADAMNLTTTAGWLFGYDATALPANGGALTPALVRFCVPLGAAATANGAASPASISHANGKAFSTGISIGVSSTNCGIAAPVYTTGTVTAYISGQYR